MTVRPIVRLDREDKDVLGALLSRILMTLVVSVAVFLALPWMLGIAVRIFLIASGLGQ